MIEPTDEKGVVGTGPTGSGGPPESHLFTAPNPRYFPPHRTGHPDGDEAFRCRVARIDADGVEVLGSPACLG